VTRAAEKAPDRRPLPPGLVKPRRFRPKLAWELVGCAGNGHELVGTDAARVDGADSALVHEHDGLRWHRCLRCDSWLPLVPPERPSRDAVPARGEIELPLRGRPLRDRYVLRAIAIDRVIHFLLIGALAVGVLVFLGDRSRLRGSWTRILNRLQGAVGGPLADSKHGLLNEVDRLFTVSSTTLLLYGLAFAAYALINLIEAIGLWRARRWAEYLTLIEVVALVPYEIYELTKRISALKILGLVINLAVVAYLLYAHRLFGVRGGGRADRAERERDTGWPALDRAYPPQLLPDS
jgi:uncharacterized membrane protein (DUF2068 family)